MYKAPRFGVKAFGLGALTGHPGFLGRQSKEPLRYWAPVGAVIVPGSPAIRQYYLITDG